tara:strand:+ start:960 stop:1271 length:312 start_codon:yes stop_codon:yes gene_type:complete
MSTCGSLILGATSVEVLFLIPALLIVLSTLPVGALMGRSFTTPEERETGKGAKWEEVDEEDEEGVHDDSGQGGGMGTSKVADVGEEEEEEGYDDSPYPGYCPT